MLKNKKNKQARPQRPTGTSNGGQGKFIVFEGLDGSGSSTQVAMLIDFLKTKYKTFLTKEPTNGLIGGLVRSQLTGDWKASPECLQLLFAADRAHHLQREIIPALKEKRIVVCDRYFFSTIAYGGLELKKDWLMKLNQLFIVPDLTIILKVRPSECIKRIKGSRFRLELFEKEKKLKKVWQNYQWLVDKYPNVKIIDGEQDKNAVFQEVVKQMAKIFDKKDLIDKK